MTPKVRVDFFFDVISPYSWIGFEGLSRYASVWPLDVRLRPFHFPAAVKSSGNSGAPMLVPVKEQYLYKDLGRAAKHWGMDIRLPNEYKKMIMTRTSVGAQRMLLTVQEREEKYTGPLARALWKRLYTDNLGIWDDDDLTKVMKEVGVSDPSAVLESSRSAEIKDRLKANTTEALSTGCFGAPWMHVHTSAGVESFFGSDRLPFIADLIGQKYDGPRNPK